MRSWLLKAAVQNIIGRMPNCHLWNSIFQKHVTKAYYPKLDTFKEKLIESRFHLDLYFKHSSLPKQEFAVFELGTGPWPFIPICLYLCGASEIWSYDLHPLLSKDMMKKTLSFYCENAEDRITEILGPVRKERLSELQSLWKFVDEEEPDKLLRRINFYYITGDARTSNLPNGSIDFIFSTLVLEHIEPEVLIGLFDEFRRIASQDAVMCHYIGLADQYASVDKSITPFNHMKYTDFQWRLFNNPIVPQSRLRIADYRHLFNQSGWNIVEEKNTLGLKDDLDSIAISSKFKHFSMEDLLVLYSWIIAKSD